MSTCRPARSRPEIPLVGGDVTDGVVRVGDTVRRPVGEHSDLVHAALRHLESVGFDGAPRFLGIDERGREILTFLYGEVAIRPWPAWVADESRAVSVARLLRRLDDAMEPYGIPDGVPVTGPARPGEPARPGPPPTFLGHRDVTPENTVFRSGVASALLDFDLMRPSSRVDEVANLLLWWGGWMAPADRQPVMRGVDPRHRGRALVAGYGLADDLVEFVVPVSISAARRSWHSMKERAETHGGGWARMWAAGVGDQIQRRAAWLEENAARLNRALTE